MELGERAEELSKAEAAEMSKDKHRICLHLTSELKLTSHRPFGYGELEFWVLESGSEIRDNHNSNTVKNLPAMQETRVRSLGQENGMATHSCNLAWRIPWTEKAGVTKRHDWASNSLHFIIQVLIVHLQAVVTLGKVLNLSLFLILLKLEMQ